MGSDAQAQAASQEEEAALSAEVLLARLDKVRQTSQGQYLACCPAHADRSPSLSVKDCGGGLTLVHCFGGCDTESILDAVGLTFDDLFPERLPDPHKPQRRAYPAADVLTAVATEMRIVAVVASTLKQGQPLHHLDHDRLLLACERVEAARALALD